MNTINDFDRRAAAWLADGPHELNDRVLDAALREVHLTHQRRRWSAPWRTSLMSLRLGLAAAVTVIVIAVGGALIVGGGPALQTPPPSPPRAASPTASASPIAGASPVAPGIVAWTGYTSEAYGFTLGLPDDWTVHAAATRRWQASDRLLDIDEWPYAEAFESPDESAIGLFVWEMPAGEGADVETVAGLKAWAATFCNDVGLASCQEFARGALPMCLNEGGDSCRGAILVPTATQQYAFFVDWGSAMLTSSPDRVRVVVVAREDSFSSAARYGGSVELLRSILTTMNVWTPGQVPPAN